MATRTLGERIAAQFIKLQADRLSEDQDSREIRAGGQFVLGGERDHMAEEAAKLRDRLAKLVNESILAQARELFTEPRQERLLRGESALHEFCEEFGIAPPQEEPPEAYRCQSCGDHRDEPNRSPFVDGLCQACQEPQLSGYCDG